MAFTISIKLPRERYRKLGVLNVYGAAGDLAIGGIPCYGKADTVRARREGNPSRDPRLPFGGTPLGLYGPTRLLRYEP